MYKSYAGIGSRETPEEIISKIKEISKRLANLDYVLRSGGAGGADIAFEEGCDDVSGKKEIFLPWKNFNNNHSPLYLGFDWKKANPIAIEYAQKYHPYWNRLKFPAKKFMIRNSFQIMGWNMNKPIDFVVCYTSDGKFTGGTGQALRIAKDKNIPIYNLFFEKDYENIMKV